MPQTKPNHRCFPSGRFATTPILLAAAALIAAPTAQAQTPADTTAPADPASLRFSASTAYALNSRQPTTTHNITATKPLEEAPRIAPSGVYFRISGLYVDPQDDPVFLDGSGTLGTDDGAGISLAIGLKDLNRPLSYELEYAYRTYKTDSYTDAVSGRAGDTDVSVHTLGVNVLFDQPDIVGPVGLYAGLGVGVRINEFEYSNSDGSSDAEINGNGVFWQAMAGVTYSVSPDFQIYGGVRWLDAGSEDNSTLSIDTASLNFELGVRIYF